MGVKECVGACTAPCFGGSDGVGADGHLRRRNGRARWEGRAERNFDFYDDWDFDDGGLRGGRGGGGSAIFGWGSGELDRLLAGSGSARSRRRNAGVTGGAGELISHQPRRQRAMSYGTRARMGRRKSSVLPSDGEAGFDCYSQFVIFGVLGTVSVEDWGKRGEV